jgi:GNAT superfamily N-acetyltransferase
LSPTNEELFIRELRTGDKVKSLSLGKKEHAPLKAYLQKSAHDFHRDNIAKTYVLVDQEENAKVLGYMSLMCSEINLVKEQRPRESKNASRYDVFPAVKIARLAVDSSLQGKGFGFKLVVTAIAMIKDYVMPSVGCRFLIVDSKPGSVSFYQRLGFVLLDHPENEETQNPLMFLDMNNYQ